MNKVFITGGAGYVGAVMVTHLLEQGFEVTVLDLMIYGEHVLEKHDNLNCLLYTSPSPRDRTRSRMPSSA